MNSLSGKFKLSKIDSLSTRKLYLPIVILGMLLAARIQNIQHGWINPDSVLYFESARLFALGDWQGAIKVFNWPLYSILIAATHKLTTLNIHTSAQLLSVIFFGITTASFLKIIELAGGGTRVMLAGALILFSSHYLVGDVLEMLMRDQGFWAFYLTSLVFFIRFFRTKSYMDAFFWQTSAILATLFRIEAISYLIFLPAILLFTQHGPWKQRLGDFLKCNFLNIIAGVSIISFLFLHNDLSMSSFGRLREVFTTNLFQELTQQLHEKSAIMAKQVLGKYLQDFAVQGLLLTFVYIMIAKAISSIGVINVGLTVFAIKSRRSLMDEQAFRVLSVAAIIAIINMALIITKVFVLSGRYVLALSLILMIFASFYLASLFKYLQPTSTNERKLKWLTVALIVFMSLSLVKNILPKEEGYNYLQDAAAWVRVNNKDNRPVFYDDSRVRYYAGAPFVGTWGNNWLVTKSAIEDNSIIHYDYLLISYSVMHPEREKLLIEKLPQYREIKRFSSAKAKKSIVIYQNTQKRQ